MNCNATGSRVSALITVIRDPRANFHPEAKMALSLHYPHWRIFTKDTRDTHFKFPVQIYRDHSFRLFSQVTNFFQCLFHLKKRSGFEMWKAFQGAGGFYYITLTYPETFVRSDNDMSGNKPGYMSSLFVRAAILLTWEQIEYASEMQRLVGRVRKHMTCTHTTDLPCLINFSWMGYAYLMRCACPTFCPLVKQFGDK